MIDLTINGQPLSVAEESSLAEVLAQTQKVGPAIAVELNGDVVPREQYGMVKLRAGDILEVVTLVGGG